MDLKRFLFIFVAGVTAGGANAATQTDVGVNGQVTNTIVGPSFNYTFTDERLATPGVLSLISVSGSDSIPSQADISSYGASREGFIEADAHAYYDVGYNNSYAESTSTSTFLDDFTVESLSLPVGTPVNVTFSMDIIGSVQSSFQSIGLGTGSLSVSDPPGGGATIVNYDYKIDGGSKDLVATLSGVVGDRMRMVCQLRAGTYIESVTGVLSEDVNLQAQGFGWTDNANIFLASDSGHDYAAVPEPSSIVYLSGFGLCGLTVLLRKRKRI